MTNVESLQSELERLKEEILKMGRLTQDQIAKAVKALVDKDMALARKVIDDDDLVDSMELELEKKSLELIALKQPMAGDLRLIGTVLKIIVDMERIGDLAEDVAEIAIKLYEQKYMKQLIDIPRMACLAQDMGESALKALIDRDVPLAMTLIDMERQMDALHDQVFRELLSYMMQDQRNIPQATSLLMVAAHLERIGDHTTNIGEMVIYVVEGRRLDLNEMARRS